jgi:NADH:ubiquinone oxidoreductase subunit H
MLTWIAWQRLYTLGLRIIMVWIYNNTGRSVFATIVFHTMDNVSFSLFPNYGSHYDPFFVWFVITIAAVMVTFIWGPKTLARYRYARVGKNKE